MKKNILLILTFIISFILLIDNAYAAKELTCWYGNGVQQPGVIVSQNSKGNRTYWIYDADKNIQYAKQISGVEENKEELTSCPKCLDFIDSTNFFTSKHTYEANYAGYDSGTKCEDKYVKLYNSYEKAWTKENIENRKFLSTADLTEKQKNNMAVCSYNWSYAQGIIFYIDKSTNKIYSNIIEYDNNPGSGNSFILKFTKYDFEKVYNESKCPGEIFMDTEGEGNGSYGEMVNTYKFYLDSSEASKDASVFDLKNQSDKEEESDEEPDVEINNCGDLFSDKLVKKINNVMNIIRIAVPILLIIFGIVDFFKATFDNNEDEMKKDRERFIKRIIAAIIVFLVPLFVNLVLDVANIVWSDINSDTCISTNE